MRVSEPSRLQGKTLFSTAELSVEFEGNAAASETIFSLRTCCAGGYKQDKLREDKNFVRIAIAGNCLLPSNGLFVGGIPLFSSFLRLRMPRNPLLYCVILSLPHDLGITHGLF